MMMGRIVTWVSTLWTRRGQSLLHFVAKRYKGCSIGVIMRGPLRGIPADTIHLPTFFNPRAPRQLSFDDRYGSNSAIQAEFRLVRFAADS